MKSRRVGQILFGVTLLAVAGGAALLVRGREEPVYQGRGISYWFNDRQWMQGPALDAFHSFGSKAVPYLAAQIRQEDSRWADWYRRNWRHLPVWLRWRVPVPDLPNSRRDHALAMLALLGPEARSVMPELIAVGGRTYRKQHQLPADFVVDWFRLATNLPARLAQAGGGTAVGTVITNKSGVVMMASGANTSADFLWQSELKAMAEIGGDNPELLPLLLVALREARPVHQSAIASWLRKCRATPAALRAAEPVLLAALQDPQPIIRASAASLLLPAGAGGSELLARMAQWPTYGPLVTEDAERSHGLLPSLCRLLADTKALVAGAGSRLPLRSAAVGALVQLGTRDVAGLSGLQEALLEPEAGVRAGVAEALGRMGVAALTAVPELTSLAGEGGEPDALVRYQAAVALWRITGSEAPLAAALAAAYGRMDRGERAEAVAFWDKPGATERILVPALTAVLSPDASYLLRGEVAASAGDASAVSLLPRELPNVTNPSARREAEEALRKISARKSGE